MDGAGAAFVAGLRTCFAGVDDPRVQGRCDHTLLDIIALTLLASMCGADDWPDVEVFGLHDLSGMPTLRELGEGAELLAAPDLTVTDAGVVPTPPREGEDG